MKPNIFTPQVYPGGEPCSPTVMVVCSMDILITVAELYQSRVESVRKVGVLEAKRQATLAGADAVLIDYILYYLWAPSLEAQTAGLRKRLEDPTMHVCSDCLILECIKIGINPFVSMITPEYKEKYNQFMEAHAAYKMN